MAKNTPSEDDVLQLVQKHMSEAHGGRKDAIDVLKTAIWYSEVRLRLDAPSAYAIERLLEPEAFTQNEQGRPTHWNKWTKYRVGRRLPQQSLVKMVEHQLPGTEWLLNHALWKALRLKPGTPEDVEGWLRQLDPDVQAVISPRRRGPQRGLLGDGLTRLQLEMLERRAGLDALACLTIFLTVPPSRDAQGKASVVEVAATVYRVLLMLCTTARTGKFAMPLLQIYRERIFSPERLQGQKLYLEDSEFVEATRLLSTLLLALEDKKLIGLNWSNSVLAMYKLMHGDYGFHIQFALDPLFGPDGPVTESNISEYRELERRKRFRSWGREEIFSAERQALPPRELW